MLNKSDVLSGCDLNNAEIDAYCMAWAKWCRTRRYYIKPASQNILARMQPSRCGEAPDARNYPDMQYFNMAVHTLADMKKYEDEYKAFMYFFQPRELLVKQIAAELKIGNRTYYDHVKRFARAAYAMSNSIKRAHESMARNFSESAKNE